LSQIPAKLGVLPQAYKSLLNSHRIRGSWTTYLHIFLLVVKHGRRRRRRR
jgi:hypothetical protein